MCSIEQQQQGRRLNNRLNLTVTPAFPILISTDIAIIKEKSANIQVSRSRSSSSIHLAEELSPENQSKVFSNDLWDRLSLISSTESVTSIWENSEKFDEQLADQEKNCLHLTDWLIKSMEERQWKEVTEGIDFMEEVDAALYLQPPSESDFRDAGEFSNIATAKLEEFFRKEEGNSIFYTNSQLAVGVDGCSQIPSTSSRVYEVSSCSAQNSPNSDVYSRQNSQQSKRRKSIGDIEGKLHSNNHEEENGLVRSNSVQQLVSALANTNTFQKSLKNADILKTFKDVPNIQQISYRNWRPPRKKFIFELQKPNDFLTQIALQKYRCAGCGLKLLGIYAKRAQFCNYFSKLFCQCCHQGARRRIPARILHEWNFKEYSVCDIAHTFLAENEDQPVFNVKLINPGLYKKARNLRRFRKFRLKIGHMWPFVQKCKLSEQLMTKNGILRTMFTSVPKRFFSLESIDVYSLVDFERIANKNLLELLEPLVLMGSAHIEGCLHCRQHAFFCQICMDPSDLLFPFQLDRCYRCDGCGSLSHIKCFKSATTTKTTNGIGLENFCKKCERIRRKRLQLRRASTDQSICDSA